MNGLNLRITYKVPIMMDLQIVNILRCLKIFVIVWLYVGKTNSISLSDLRSVCCIDTGTENIITLGNASKYCTAISSFSENKRTTMNDIVSLRGDLPYVYIYDNKSFRKMKNHIKGDNVDGFIEEIAKLINDNKIDAMAFDNFDSDIRKWQIDMEFQERLRDFFHNLTKRFPDKLFGLLIPKEKHILKKAFDPSVIDSSIDFYIIRSLSYTICERKFHQDLMPVTSPVENMNKTLQMLIKRKYNLNKFLLDIRIIVNNVNYHRASGKNDNSYAYHCANDPKNKYAKYCSDTLGAFYEKGDLVNQYSMLGAYIHSFDRDDYIDSCGCGAFPVLTVIDAALSNAQVPNITACSTWRLLPRDKINLV